MADETQEVEDTQPLAETVRIAYRGEEKSVRCGGRTWKRNVPQDVDAECAAIVLTHPSFRRVRAKRRED